MSPDVKGGGNHSEKISQRVRIWAQSCPTIMYAWKYTFGKMAFNSIFRYGTQVKI